MDAEDAPRVTVVIVTWNAQDDIEACLAGICSQSFPAYRVLIIDSASSDSTVSRVRSRFPGVEVVALDKNVGYRRGNQLGMITAKGDYVVVCNDDVEVEPDWLARMVEAMERDAGLGLVTPKILLHDRRSLINTAGNSLHFSGLYGMRGFGQPQADFSQSEELAAVSGCCFMIRRRALEDTGGFSPDFDRLDTGWHASFEDVDLCWRARLTGWRIGYVPDAVMYHKYDRKPTTPAMFASFEWGRLLTVMRNYSARNLLLIAPVLAIFEVFTWAYAAARGAVWLRAKWRVWAWLMTHPAEVHLMRQRVQSGRKVPDRVLLRKMRPTLRLAQFLPWPLLGKAGEKALDLILSFYYHILTLELRPSSGQ